MKRIIFFLMLSLSLLSATVQAQADETRAHPRILFKPPQMGAPTTRVGGGTRGLGGASTQIQLLASEQTGLSSVASPVLYWYSSNAPAYDIELTVRLDDNDPILEKNIGALKTAGIQVIRLSDYGVKLDAGKDYTWSISVIVDPKQRSADLFASATIRYEKPRAPLKDVVEMASSGYWYDSVSQLIETKSPDLEDLLQQASIRIAASK